MGVGEGGGGAGEEQAIDVQINGWPIGFVRGGEEGYSVAGQNEHHILAYFCSGVL